MNKVYTLEGEIIRAHRMELGYSQHYLAHTLGIELRSYQRLEYGERSILKANILLGLALCRMLEIDPISLIWTNREMLDPVFLSIFENET